MTAPLRTRLRTAAARTLFVCLCLSPGAASARGQEAAKDFKIDRFEWTADSELSGAVRSLAVRNDYGDIRARSAGDGLLSVSAVIQRLGSSPDIGVNVERHGDTLAVNVVSPPGRRAVTVARLGKAEVDRADLVVYVPAGASLEAASFRGIVEARRLKGRLDVETLDGEIRAESEGPVRARSASGDVTVSVGRAADAATVIETGSGNVWLSLLENGNHLLHVDAGGRVTSAIALTDRTEGAVGRLRMTGATGNGSVPVIVRTESGAVEIKTRRE